MKKLKVLAVNDPAVNAYLHKEDNQITKAWEERHQIKVVIDIIEWSQYKDRLDRALKSKAEDYDIVMNPGNFWLPELAEEKLIIPLDEYLSDYDLGGIVNSIQDELKYKNRIYMLPSFSDGHILFYRKDIFEEKGIRFLKKTTSIPELKEILHQLEDIHPVIALKSDISEILLDVIPFLWDRGVEVSDKPPYFSNEEKTMLALQDYLAFKPYCPNGIEHFGNQQVKEAIQKGEVVLGVSWGGQAAAILDPKENPFIDQIGFVTYQHPCNTTWGFVVAANSTKKDEAVSYMTFVTNEENDRLVGRISGAPVRKTTYQDPNEKELCPWYEVQYEMLKNAKNVPKSVDFAHASVKLYALLHDFFTGKITVNQLMENCRQGM